MDDVCKGIMGVIGCPMLEDELIYDLIMDPEEKDIYLVDDEHSGSLKRKLQNNSLKFKSIDKYEFDNGVEGIDRDRFNVVITMNDLGLHAEPKDLRSKIEEQVTMAQGRFDVLALFYGTCGNAMWDISKWAVESGIGMPVTVFRDQNGKPCDDCIGVAVGGTAQYLSLIKKYTGMLLLTPAVATNWVDFLGASDMMRGVSKDKMTDMSMMKWIFEFCGYKYAVKIDTGLGERDKYQTCAEDLCKEMNLELIEGEPGLTTLDPAKRIYRESKDALRKVAGSS